MLHTPMFSTLQVFHLKNQIRLSTLLWSVYQINISQTTLSSSSKSSSSSSSSSSSRFILIRNFVNLILCLPASSLLSDKVGPSKNAKGIAGNVVKSLVTFLQEDYLDHSQDSLVLSPSLTLHLLKSFESSSLLQSLEDFSRRCPLFVLSMVACRQSLVHYEASDASFKAWIQNFLEASKVESSFEATSKDALGLIEGLPPVQRRYRSAFKYMVLGGPTQRLLLASVAILNLIQGAIHAVLDKGLYSVVVDALLKDTTLIVPVLGLQCEEGAGNRLKNLQVESIMSGLLPSRVKRLWSLMATSLWISLHNRHPALLNDPRAVEMLLGCYVEAVEEFEASNVDPSLLACLPHCHQHLFNFSICRVLEQMPLSTSQAIKHTCPSLLERLDFTIRVFFNR